MTTDVRQRMKEPATQLRIGLVFLILANAWKFLVHPSAAIPESMVDGVMGLLYGLSIGCMMLALARKRRKLATPDGGRCL